MALQDRRKIRRGLEMTAQVLPVGSSWPKRVWTCLRGARLLFARKSLSMPPISRPGGYFMKKRILFTGGSGKAGRHAVAWLVNAGYEVHNVDLVPLESPGVTNLIADITDSGQMFNVLSMHRDFPDL